MSRYKVILHPDVVGKDIPQLPPTIKTRIRRAIAQRLFEEPEKYGKPMRFTAKGLWRIRVGDYRVVYTVKSNEVLIFKIGHRKDVYKDFESRKLVGK